MQRRVLDNPKIEVLLFNTGRMRSGRARGGSVRVKTY
jgi:hypothetical protein